MLQSTLINFTISFMCNEALGPQIISVSGNIDRRKFDYPRIGSSLSLRPCRQARVKSLSFSDCVIFIYLFDRQV